MNYTPHGNLTRRELILAVVNQDSPTDFELELVERLSNIIPEASTYEDGYSAGYAAGVLKKIKETS